MYCYSCMKEIEEGTVCEECISKTYESKEYFMKPGSMLNERYFVGYVFCEEQDIVSYIGLDTMRDVKVIIKEYKSFLDGKQKFIEESKTLERFGNEKGIEGVWDSFEANNTAYRITEYFEGLTLTEYVKKYGRIEAMRVFALMRPIMESLRNLHGDGIYHRNITPDHILFLKNGTLKLTGLRVGSVSVGIKRGFTPEERYRQNGQQGPWTDVYGLCATMYYLITGIVPEDALDRLHTDTMKLPSAYQLPIPPLFEDILSYGLAVRTENRCKTVAEMLHILDTAPSLNATFKNPTLNTEKPSASGNASKQSSSTLIIIICVILLSVGAIVALATVLGNNEGGLIGMFGGTKQTVEKEVDDEKEEEEKAEEDDVAETPEDTYEEEQDAPWDEVYEEDIPDYEDEFQEEPMEESYVEGQIFPDSAERYLTDEDLWGLTAEECRLARNEIYARRGRKFQDKELQKYFEQFDWYHPSIEPDDFKENMLNKYEKENRDKLVEYEEEMGYR